MNRRKNRLEQEIRIIISNIFLRDINDPRIGFITINTVELSPDLKYAKIFVSIYGNEGEKEKGMKGLKSATNHIQELLAAKLRVKNVPFLQFSLDESVEKGIRLTKLIEKVTKGETENQ